MKKLTKKLVNQLCYQIVGCAIEVHKELGPGLLESIHRAQLMTYLNLTKKPKSLIINFNVQYISTTVVPLVNDVFAKLPLE